jgi:hypothetical protein
MSYLLRIDGRPRELFDHLEDALARVRFLLRVDPNCEPELCDAETGQPIGPGATLEEREEMARRIGF